MAEKKLGEHVSLLNDQLLEKPGILYLPVVPSGGLLLVVGPLLFHVIS